MKRSGEPRRWCSLGFLALAGGMLFWGQTVLKTRLEGKTFIIYWTLCFLFAGLAIISSLVESMQVRREYRRQQRELIEKTLREIDRKSSK